MNTRLDLVIPHASSIQIGEREIIHFISRKNVLNYEGEFSKMANEVSQTSSAKFLNLFWFLKPKDYPTENEKQLDLITLDLNLNYGNLRINGYQDVSGALHNQAIFITKDNLTVNAAIYPAGVFNIRHLKNGLRYRPIEQIYVRYNPQEEPWHDELTRSDFQKQNDKLKMTISRGEEKYFYLFENGQLDMFNYALDFVLTHGLTIVGSKK